MSKIKREVYHPSLYINEYIESLEMTQDEFAKRLGISGKQLSLLLSKKANITVDIAYKLSSLTGTSMEFWQNLQSMYDAYIISLDEENKYLRECKYFKMIDKDFLVNIKIINHDDKINEAIKKLRSALPIASLELLSQPDLYSTYRTSSSISEQEKNIVCRNVWVSIAFKQAKKIDTKPFDENKLLESIALFRSMTLQAPEVFFPKLQDVLSKCGVALVVLPTLRNSNINGVTKWISNEKAMVALNTRGAYNDKFWFSFFHELKHVLQKTKRRMITGTEGNVLEADADFYACEVLIPNEKWKQFKNYTREGIIKFATTIKIHPGIVVGRLQKEKLIEYSMFNDLKVKYEIC